MNVINHGMGFEQLPHLLMSLVLFKSFGTIECTAVGLAWARLRRSRLKYWIHSQRSFQKAGLHTCHNCCYFFASLYLGAKIGTAYSPEPVFCTSTLDSGSAVTLQLECRCLACISHVSGLTLQQLAARAATVWLGKLCNIVIGWGR